MSDAADHAYVLGDWGTSRLRLFLMSGDAVRDRRDGPGIGQLDAPPGVVLERALMGWPDVTDVTLCGMAGARGGLIEAPYVPCPAERDGWRARMVSLTVSGVPVRVSPGLCVRDAADIPDVMRGEETQIFGAMLLDPALASGPRRFVLPGTHSKWAHISYGAIGHFRTWFTGELHALLTTRSTLAGGDGGPADDFDQGFARGLARRDEPVHAAFFEARAGRLLDGRTDTWSKGYLSGLLIGGEVAAYPVQPDATLLIGDPALCALYARAFDLVGQSYRIIDGEAAALAGLQFARGTTA